MGKLNTAPNLADADRIYELLINLHAGRSEQESQVVSARLILTLANHIGDEQVIAEAIALAGEHA